MSCHVQFKTRNFCMHLQHLQVTLADLAAWAPTSAANQGTEKPRLATRTQDLRDVRLGACMQFCWYDSYALLLPCLLGTRELPSTRPACHKNDGED